MLACPNDGRHFRAFINEAKVVKAVSELSFSLQDAVALMRTQNGQHEKPTIRNE
jgi:hypothetical protein